MQFGFIKNWYIRYERLISSLSLLGGFVFDIFALKRIDLFWDNLWVAVHLLVAAIGIILINLFENRKHLLAEKVAGRIHFWLIITIQFAFGGLLSTFLVFYFRSGTFATSWPFLLFLAVVFALNEILKKHYTRLVFQTIVLFISIYSFAIFIVPVTVHQIGDGVFLLSGVISLMTLGLFVLCLRYIARERFHQSRKMLIFHITLITLVINILYFTNLIPPIPLSLKDAGVYHSLSRNSAGNYTATGEAQTFWDFFKSYEPYDQIIGQPIYVFSSIFSPTNLNTTIVHDWQHYDESTKKWQSVGKIQLSIVGGREGGFRTYSIRNITIAGLWRVDVETLRGQLIDRVKFEVKKVDVLPQLVTKVLD